MPPALQVKLLRVLQERKVQRLGSTQAIPINARIVAATNINLLEAVERKTFREDLYSRLNVITLTLPPLRERDGVVATHPYLGSAVPPQPSPKAPSPATNPRPSRCCPAASSRAGASRSSRA